MLNSCMKYDSNADFSPKPMVVVTGDFNPPCNHHQMLIRAAQKVAESLDTNYIVYLRPGGILSEAKQEAYFLAAFPSVPYRKVESCPFPDDRDIYVIGESLQVYELAESVEIPKVNSKLRIEAASGNYYNFKTHLPIGMKDVDARSLFNDMRDALGYSKIDFTRKDPGPIRESYVKGERYRVGDVVYSEGTQLTISKRGANYLICTDSNGRVHQKWLHDVSANEPS